MNLIVRAIQATRDLTAELSPPILRSGDLSASLRWLAQWMAEHQSFEIKAQAEDKIMLDRKDLTVLLYPSIRKLLFNVIKHAGAKSAEVKIERQNGNLVIAVSDQGAGFDPEVVWENPEAAEGYGLLTLWERFMHLSGKKPWSVPGRSFRMSS